LGAVCVGTGAGLKNATISSRCHTTTATAAAAASTGKRTRTVRDPPLRLAEPMAMTFAGATAAVVRGPPATAANASVRARSIFPLARSRSMPFSFSHVGRQFRWC
jgi:hypothetical protein